MEKNGYIESFQDASEIGKKRTYYRITDTGRTYYREKCDEWQLTKEVVEVFIHKKPDLPGTMTDAWSSVFHNFQLVTNLREKEE